MMPRHIRRTALRLLAAGLLLTVFGCGANDTYSPTAGGAVSQGSFTVTAKPASSSVTIGNATSYTVTVTSVNGFSSPVTLSASGVPSGAAASFSQNPVTPPANGSANSTLTID